MFEIESQYSVNSHLPVITDNYKILHFDEYPILFCGTNKFGNKLVGSLAYEDEEADTFRYFVILVENKLFSDFLNQCISYQSLIKQSGELFVVDKDINDKILRTFHITLDQIPSDYLPSKSSYIPEDKATSQTLQFAFALKGKLADLHKGRVVDINTITGKINNYLNETLETLNIFDLQPQIYEHPSQAASFRLNFNIEFRDSGQVSMFPVDRKQVAGFLNQYLNYVAYVLPNDVSASADQPLEDSKGFKVLEESLKDIYENSNIRSSSALADMLVDSIGNSAKKLSEVSDFLNDNESFSGVEIGNYNESGQFYTMGYLDSSYTTLVEAKLPEELPIDADVTSDEEQQDYRILVYKLNRETGKGAARLYFEDERFSKILLHIDIGDKDLTQSKFTNSLNEDKVVDVKGIAIKKNGIYWKLDCYL